MQFMYVGANGAYTTDTAQAMAQTGTATNSTTLSGLLGGTVWGGGYYQGQANQQNQLNQYQIGSFGVVGSTVDPLDTEETTWKKKFRKKFPEGRQIKSLLHRLQHEIDGWHGDILERCPA